jgi:hypothetical protein
MSEGAQTVVLYLPILQDERLSIMQVSGWYYTSIMPVSCGYDISII